MIALYAPGFHPDSMQAQQAATFLVGPCLTSLRWGSWRWGQPGFSTTSVFFDRCDADCAERCDDHRLMVCAPSPKTAAITCDVNSDGRRIAMPSIGMAARLGCFKQARQAFGWSEGVQKVVRLMGGALLGTCGAAESMDRHLFSFILAPGSIAWLTTQRALFIYLRLVGVAIATVILPTWPMMRHRVRTIILEKAALGATFGGIDWCARQRWLDDVGLPHLCHLI